MASGDILSCTIRADGWSADVVVDGAGFAVGATYDFGSLGNSPATVDNPKFTMTVVSEGYNASGVLGTVTRTVYGTHVVRKPYPNQASKDETDSGTTLSMRVALSECVYADDKNGGAGTSGTDPTVTIAAGWCVSGANSSNAATNLACTNNSTLAYPKVVAQWAWGHTPAWRRVTADTSIGCIAYHGHGITCVALSATDAHAHAVSGTATAKTAHQMSASSLYYESYDLAVPVASFTDGDDVTLRFIAYPLVGDASSIVDTSLNTTSTDDIRGLTQITFTKNPTVTTKYVAQNGNDTTGDGTTGTPYATIGKALSTGAEIIYVQAGGTNVVDILGAAPASVAAKNFFIDVMPKPGDEATVSLTRTSAGLAWKAKLLRYSGFTMSGGNAFIDGGAVAGAKLWLQNMNMSVASAPVTGLGYRAEGVFLVNCTETSGVDDFKEFSADVKGYSFTGCSFTSGAKIWKTSGFIASSMSGSGTDKNVIEGNQVGTGTAIENNLIFANSKLVNCTMSGNQILTLGRNQAITSAAVVGNLIEFKSGSQPAMWIGADSASVAIDSLVVAHNTIAGERANLFYNDVGTTANVRTNIFCRNNAFNGFAIKTDTFGTQSGNRVGNWAQINGVNFSDNRFSGQPALSTFVQDYSGINVKYETDAATFSQLGFTTDNSKYGAGTGNGNYLPTGGSVLKNHTLRQKYQSFDLDGVAL